MGLEVVHQLSGLAVEDLLDPSLDQPQLVVELLLGRSPLQGARCVGRQADDRVSGS